MTEQLTEQYTEAQEASPSAPPELVRISWAPIARVNLLPIEIIESRRFRRTQGLLGATVVGALLLAGAGTLLAQRSVSQAEDDLTVAQAQVTALQADQAKYATVPQVLAQVTAATEARTSAMGNDVLWYRYLNDLDGARPAGVTFTSMTLTLNATTGTTTANPLSAPAIGSVAIDGTAGQYDQISSWLEALNKITGVATSSLSNAAKGETGLTYTSGAVITTDALSNRYQKKAG